MGNDYTLNLAREKLARLSRHLTPILHSSLLSDLSGAPELNAQKGAYAAAVAHGWSSDVLQLHDTRTVDQCTSQRKAELSC